jgi:hypothetical protein
MENFFHTISRQMAEQIRLISQEISHPGMKGDSGEELIRQFLKKYLPKKYSIAQGKVVDFTGNESKQIDIIIYDALQTIPFYTDEKNSIIPIENVFAIIEVKTAVNKAKLIEAIEVFKSSFDLQAPSEYFNALNGGLAVKDLSLYNHFKFHPKCFLLGLDSSRSITTETLMYNYLSYVKEKHINFPIISFCGILNESFFTDSINEEKAEHAKEPCEVYLNKKNDNTLLFFLLNLVGNMDLNLKKRQPDYSLYLTFYNKLSSKERLSDGWLFH